MSLELFFDPQLLRLTVIIATPFVLAALGELITERSGVLNVGAEGVMAVGAAVGFLGAWATGGSYLSGVVAAMAAGGLLSLIVAVYGVSLRGQQITVGLGVLVFGLGLASLIYRAVVGVQLQSPRVEVLAPIHVPLLSAIPLLGEVLFQHDPLVYVTVALVVIVHATLAYTPLGLRLRACGENPRAVDAVGVNVSQLRYGATFAGGMLMGLAGAYLPLVITGGYSDGMVGGRGWIALMIVILARWQPGMLLAGALLFAYVGALQFRLGLVTKAVPAQLLLALPYIVAIVVLVRVYRGAQAPAALGVPYDREARG